MRSPSTEIASCCVTTSPSTENVFGACFNTAGRPTHSISINDGGVNGPCTLASRSPLALGLVAVEAPDVDHANLGQSLQPLTRSIHPATACRLQTPAATRRGSAARACRRPRTGLATPAAAMGFEYNREIPLSRQKSRQRHADHRVRRIGPARHRPGRTQLDDKPVLICLQPDVGRHVELHSGARRHR